MRTEKEVQKDISDVLSVETRAEMEKFLKEAREKIEKHRKAIGKLSWQCELLQFRLK